MVAAVIAQRGMAGTEAGVELLVMNALEGRAPVI
jgi:hypothetical protein